MPKSKTRKKPAGPRQLPVLRGGALFQERVFRSTSDTVHMVRIVEENRETPEKIGLTHEKLEEVHLLLRASALGLLTVMAELDGSPDPRIEAGESE